jgi:DNA-directed RNA polymerase specialized sigma24 family protein
VRYFGGLPNEEIAGFFGVSVKSVERDLRYGRAFLYREIGKMERASG